MKHFITFISTMALLLLLAMPAFSQEITVRFTGQINGTDYCRLDRVAVINVTRNWTEMVEYPDTIIVLGSTVGANLNIAAVQGLGQNIPNPFDCETRVELSVSQREDVRIQLLDVAGKLYAEYNGSLDAGMHAFDISAANPQTYLLNATVGNRQYSIRMVNVGSGCGCSIKYAGVSGGIEAKLTSANEFLIGDNMRYVGYTTIDGESVASAMVEQMQVISQTITLNFTHYSSPRVETLSATNITATGATLNGKVTSNGGTTVTARGFKYGTSASNLSQNVQSGSGTGNYTKALTGLSSGTTYYYKAYATNSIGTAYGEVMSFTTQTIYPPSVQTNSATNITATSATLNGNVTSNGGATVTARGFMYGTSADNLSQSVQSGSGTGSYAANLTNLSDNTTYYYKAYATNSIGTAYGDVISFTTEDASLPTVVTNDATNVTPTGAKLNGNVTDDGGATVTERGFMYATSELYLSSFLIFGNASTVQCGSGTGSFTANITNYDDGTTIYYKAYATNCTGTAYGEIMSFTTGAFPPTVQTNSASNITSTSAKLSGNVTFNGGATVTARGFMYGTNESDLSQSIQSGSGTGSYTKVLTGLSASTTYYYKAYATNSEGTAYGEVMSFTTENASLPTVVTNNATNVTSTGAKLNGNVTDDGGATVTERGFMYATSELYLSSFLIFGNASTVQCGSGTGSFTANLTGYDVGTTIYYKAYATNSAGTAYGEVMSFATTATTGTVNGHAWVDLGLPSGTRWATCNVGSDTPEGYGNYYAWGETTTKSSYIDNNYTYTGNPTTLPSNRDAATANWGSGWRMPTKAEMEELNTNCTMTWTTQNGVNGCLFTGPNGNSIFLPAAGHYRGSSLYYAGSSGLYWSSSRYSDDASRAWPLCISSSDCGMYDLLRFYGQSVRAVCLSQN